MLDARVDRLEAALARLADAQAQTQADLRVLAEAQRRTEQNLAELVRAVKVLTDDVGALKGDALERRYREHADAYFERILHELDVLLPRDRSGIAQRARTQGLLSDDDIADLLYADIIVRGRRPDGADAFLVAEVSSVIDSRDVDRAARRAELLSRATNLSVLAVVAGSRITQEAVDRCAVSRVWQVLDGRAVPPVSEAP